MRTLILALLGCLAVLRTAEAAQGEWEMFAPGSLPPGKIVTLAESASADVGGTLHYLIGNFTVTASSAKRAALRQEEGVGPASLPNGRGKVPPVRVVVQYRSDTAPPAEKDLVVRTPKNPFLIIRVKSMPDNQTTVYVREIVR